MLRSLLSGLLLLTVTTTASHAHFHMILPDKHSVKKGEKVTITFQFGHPYESQLFSMNKPEKVEILSPDGSMANVTAKLVKVALQGEKGKVDGYRLEYTPSERGDYAIQMTSAPTYLAEDKEYIQDTVKTVLHVQAQKGWDRRARSPMEWFPLTRPYGLLPGDIFQAQINHLTGSGRMKTFSPLSDALVEVERFNSTPPKHLPDDEFITRTCKTDSNGTVTTRLPETGWWSITATNPQPHLATIAGKAVDIRLRSTFWVHVNPNAPKKPAE